MSKKKMHSRVATTGSTWCGLQISPETMLANEDVPEAFTCKNCIRADPELGETATPRPPAPSGDPYLEFAAQCRDTLETGDRLARPAGMRPELGMAYGKPVTVTAIMLDPLPNLLTKRDAAENRRKSWRRTL